MCTKNRKVKRQNWCITVNCLYNLCITSMIAINWPRIPMESHFYFLFLCCSGVGSSNVCCYFLARSSFLQIYTLMYHKQINLFRFIPFESSVVYIALSGSMRMYVCMFVAHIHSASGPIERIFVQCSLPSIHSSMALFL